MSHQPERGEKDCLNCGTQVQGRFCHKCGQENVVTHQTFWSLAKHFVFDILHFDGKFFHTISYIFTRPGFVAREYTEGKRMRYLDPIRMYLFTSAVFFLIFFSVNSLRVDADNMPGRISAEVRTELVSEYMKRLNKNPTDSVLRKRIALLRDTTKELSFDSLGIKAVLFSFDNKTYSSLKEYDSIQAALPAGEKDGWIERRFMRQISIVNEKYGQTEKSINIFLEIFLRKLPYLLFVSLPFFALILKLLYSRKKNFYYSDHAIFTLYHYVFSFLLLLLIFGIKGLQNWTGWRIFSYLQSMFIISWPVYLYLEMKLFYQQRHLKIAGKFLLLNLAGFFILLLLFVIFFLFSIFQL